MALFGPGFIQAMATAMGGQEQAANLAQQNQQIAANAALLKQNQQSQLANTAWGKALMEVLKSQQTQPTPTPPVAPPPAQTGTPGTAGLGAPGAGPGAAQAGTPQAATAAAAPAPAIATPQPGQTMQPQLPGTSLPGQDLFSQLSPSAILDQIQQDNPNMDPGVLSAIVQDHLLPLMTQQQQSGYKQFQQQMDMLKMNQEQQDRMNTLLFKYTDLQDRMANAGDNRELKLMLAEQAAGVRDMMAQSLLEFRQVEESMIKQNLQKGQADIALKLLQAQDLKAKIKKDQNAAATGGTRIATTKADIQDLQTKIQETYNLVKAHPEVVGLRGEISHVVHGVTGFVDELTGQPLPDTPENQFKSDIKEIQDAYSKAKQRGQLSEMKTERLDDEIPGLGALTHAPDVLKGLSGLYHDMSVTLANLPQASGAPVSDTQVDPNTNQPLADSPPGSIPQSDWDATSDADKETLKEYAAGKIDLATAGKRMGLTADQMKELGLGN